MNFEEELLDAVHTSPTTNTGDCLVTEFFEDNNFTHSITHQCKIYSYQTTKDIWQKEERKWCETFSYNALMTWHCVAIFALKIVLGKQLLLDSTHVGKLVQLPCTKSATAHCLISGSSTEIQDFSSMYMFTRIFTHHSCVYFSIFLYKLKWAFFWAILNFHRIQKHYYLCILYTVLLLAHKYVYCWIFMFNLLYACQKCVSLIVCCLIIFFISSYSALIFSVMHSDFEQPYLLFMSK